MKKRCFFVLLVFMFISLHSSTYKVTVKNEQTKSNISEKLFLFDIVSAYREADQTTYILNLTPEEALQIKMLFHLEPYEINLNENRNNYSSLEKINNRIDDLDTNQLAQVFSIGRSVEDRAIKAIRITNSEKENPPEILFVGLHHAREWISYEVPLSIAEFIVQNYQSNSYVKEIVDNAVIWFVPMLNPDGYLYSWNEDRMWRNNRRVHPDSTIGVDLNRNYDASWIKVDYIHGTEPFSEPETRAIKNLIENNVSSIPEEKGIHNLDGLITYHSFGQLILYPPGSTDEPPEEVELYKKLGSDMSKHIFSQCGSNYLIMQITGLYNTFGEMTEWFMINNDNKPAFTFELRPQMGSPAGFDLSADQINDTVKENIPSAFYLISSIINNFTSVNMDQDNNSINDAIQGTVYEYQCSRDDVMPEDSDSDEPDEDLNDHDNTTDNDLTIEETTPDADTETVDTSDDKVNYNSSGCSLTKLL